MILDTAYKNSSAQRSWARTGERRSKGTGHLPIHWLRQEPLHRSLRWVALVLSSLTCPLFDKRCLSFFQTTDNSTPAVLLPTPLGNRARTLKSVGTDSFAPRALRRPLLSRSVTTSPGRGKSTCLRSSERINASFLVLLCLRILTCKKMLPRLTLK